MHDNDMRHVTSNENVSTEQLTQWRKMAWQAARDGVAKGEFPFGAAVCSSSGQVVSVANNTVATTNNPSAHGEVNAIKAAGRKLDTSDLNGHWLVSTAEPCPMCLAAIVTAGITRIAFGSAQAIVTQAGYGHLGVTGCELADEFDDDIEMRGGILASRCDSLLLDHPSKR